MFVDLFRKRTSVHLYTGQGMEEGEFLEAIDDVLTLSSDYKQFDETVEEDYY